MRYTNNGPPRCSVCGHRESKCRCDPTTRFARVLKWGAIVLGGLAGYALLWMVLSLTG